MVRIPFLRPSLVPNGAYSHLLDEIDARHLYTNFGPLNQRFESRVLSEWFGNRGGCATVANATLGLMLAFHLLRRSGGRYAIMPSFTFAATPLAALWCGLEPYFVDVNPATWNMDTVALEEALGRLGSQVALVVPYTPFGSAFDLGPFRSLHQDGVPVVVDAAPAFGTFDGERHFADGFPGAVVFSFHATKAFGIGEGGLVYSGDPELAERIGQGSNFGFTRGRQSISQGLNAKLSEYSAAVALATLDCFPEKIESRCQLHNKYLESILRSGLEAHGWKNQTVCGKVPTQILTILAPPGRNNYELVTRLDAAGIECRTYFSPACHEQEMFIGFPNGGLDVTEDLSHRVLSLPFWEGMSDDMIDRIVAEVGR